jgi:RsiW-degrading membrane proteinase PrsW (M82 family)
LVRSRYLALAFAGGLASIGLASLGEMALGLDVPMQGGTVGTLTIILVVLVAPIVEECVKPLGVYLIEKEDGLRLTMNDWAMLGLFAGLGFAIPEDLLYAAGVIGYGTGASLALLGLRLLLPLHLLASMLAAVGVGMYRRTRNPVDFAVMLVPAICLHALFNFAAVIVG